MQNKRINIPPIALTGTLATTLINSFITTLTGCAPAGLMTQPYILIRHIRIVNTTAGALAVSLFHGAAAAAAAGTEFAFSAVSVPAFSYVDWYGELRLDGGNGTTTATCLCGGSTTTGLSMIVDNAEIGLS
jgi:hypothetical protein